jgi:hypothetical protein
MSFVREQRGMCDDPKEDGSAMDSFDCSRQFTPTSHRTGIGQILNEWAVDLTCLSESSSDRWWVKSGQVCRKKKGNVKGSEQQTK